MFLAAGVNDGVEHAVELAELLYRWGRGSHVNLIPFNPIEGSDYRRPYKKAVSLIVPATVDIFLCTFACLRSLKTKRILHFHWHLLLIEVWTESVLCKLFWVIGRW